jgi:antitoxin (DNA-binding transcriptional repressor) of toxin-antitoxin stability system
MKSMETIEVDKAQECLREILSRVTAGAEVVLTDRQIPLARLLPITEELSERVPGLHAGASRISDDFDDPLPEEFWTGAE